MRNYGAKDFLRSRLAAGKSIRISIQAIMAKHSDDKCIPPMFRPRFPQVNAEARDDL